MKTQILDKYYLQKKLRNILQLDRSEMASLEKWTPRNFLVRLPLKFQLSLVVISDNEIIGYTIASKKDKICHIHRIAVRSKYSRQGVGSKMVSTLVKKAISKNLKKLSVEVLKKDDLHQFYLKNSFRPLSAREQKVYSLQKDPKIRDIFLEKYLVFIKDL